MANRSITDGFSLIELAIVLGVAGMILGSGLVVAVNMNEQQRIDNTRDRLDYIMQAIDNFVDKYGHLPCPADPQAEFKDSYFGDGRASGNQLTTVTTCISNNLLDAGATNVMTGGVPTATLHISPEYALDGWNRRFTYVVDEDLTFVGTDGANGYVDDTTPTTGEIGVTNHDGSRVIYKEDHVAAIVPVLVISHGKNGYGAWPGRGGSRISVGGGGANEDENDDGDRVFVQALPSASYDDIVSFRTKWQLNGVED